MASNPAAFEVDDQTDEDFFDKLVDDDLPPTDSAPGTHSDPAKAFANLSVAGESDKGDTNSLASANTAADHELKSDSPIGQSSESSTLGSGVKVLGWNSFHADSSQNGFGSYSDFFNELDHSVTTTAQPETASADAAPLDPDTTDYWESAYPGWKYDAITQQWYQVGAADAVSDGNTTEVSYMQQASQSVSETSTSQSVSNWHHPSQANNNNGYPQHMVFDPQYPGWYYDTIAQEWRTLDTYTLDHYDQQNQNLNQNQNQNQNQNGFTATKTYSQNDNTSYHESFGQADNYGSTSPGGQPQHGSWAGLYSDDNQKNVNMWQADSMQKSAAPTSFSGNQQLHNSYASNFPTTNINQQNSFDSFGAVSSYQRANQGHNEANGTLGFHSLNAVNQPFNQANVKLSDQMHFSNDYYGSQKPVNFTQQPYQSGNQYSPNAGRSLDGRPPHALVTFGFGGKLIVMKDNSNLGSSSYGSQVRP